MKKRTFAGLSLVLLALLLLAILLVVPVAADSTAFQSPLPGSVDDITTDFEALPNYFGLGAVVALLVMVARFAGLPDGLGGKAGLAVGVFAYVVAQVLPDAQRDSLFEAMNYLAQFLVVVLGSQLTHRGAKYAGLSWWKSRDG